ncbi:MAG TPA: thiolase [Dehalococcoidia bacterium]|nr:thiolase [Dehalococcoidia bacterium]
MVESIRHKIAIVGAAETDTLGTQPDMPRLALHAQAARNALADAGLRLSDVDGILSAGASPNELSEYLGIVPRFLDGTSVGGCSFMIHVRHAAAAIQAGYCDVALITHGESGRSRVDMGGGGSRQSHAAQFESPFGAAGAPSTFSIPVLRHFHEYGTTKEQMAHVPAATREWAIRNPMAIMSEAGPITPEDVFNSRMICYPFNLFDCCLVADGGGALVIVSEDRAKDFPHKPVYVLGAGEAVAHQSVFQMRDFTTSDSSKLSGEEAYRVAGIGPQDIDHLMFYDAFSFTPMMFLEEMGIVPKGEVGPWIAETKTGPNGETIYKTGPGGEMPMNTNGGGLSYCHTGMYGMFALLESVFQLRGEAGERQVEGIQTSLAHGPGGMFAAAGTVIMSNE